MKDIEIEIIDNFETFQTIRNHWDSVYKTDPEAQFFLSWTWISGVVKKLCNHSRAAWFILAAKSTAPTSEYVAFFPLEIGIAEHPEGWLQSRLSMMGVADTEHLGFICLPEYEAAVTSAFAQFLQQQQETWAIFELENIQTSKGRMSRLLDQFSTEAFELTQQEQLSDLVDQIDNSIVPYIALPDDWEQYLQTVVSSNTRQKIRRLLRKVENSNEFHLTQVNAENLDIHLEILLGFWQTNWEGRKSADYCQKIAEKIGFVLRHCFEHQSLYLPVLWQGKQPLGAIANLMDFDRKTALFLIAGRDDTARELSSGLVLHAYGIQHAIDNKFKVYDFLMGNEAYKFSFGAKARQIKTVLIQSKRSHQNQALNLRTIPEALHRFTHYQQTNRLDQAEQGYRQILNVQPQHPGALYRLGVLMHHKGKHSIAEELFRYLLQVQPQDVKAWFSLGNLHQAQNQLPEAEAAYEQALALPSESSMLSSAIHHNLGYTLQQQNQWKAAIAHYQKSQELQPNSIEAEVILANAHYAQGTLPPEKQLHYATLNYELGTKRKQVGDLKVAIEYYRQSITMQPTLAEAHYHLGIAFQKLGNLDEAIAHYQSAQAVQPNYLQAEASLANALYAQGKLPSEKQAHYAALNYKLGNHCKQADDLETATEYYRQSLVLNPNQPEVHYHLGFALQEQGNLDEAIAHYQSAQALRLNYLEAEVGIATIFYAQDKLSPVDRDRYAALNYDLGKVHHQSGDIKAAIKYYQHAIRLKPDLTEVRDHLRQALQEEDGIKIKVSLAKQYTSPKNLA
ncbi:GNAT family N-acetyltransferase [Nostoc sp.]|uniref:GNAT family N-acetyltransferase n=1 Tax=Nostoc sp. TaxID=1180 RepID=UPI002FF49439